MLKIIGCIFLCYLLYHFRSSYIPGMQDDRYKNSKDSAITFKDSLPKLSSLQDSNRFKMVIKISGLFNREDSVVVK